MRRRQIRMKCECCGGEWRGYVEYPEGYDGTNQIEGWCSRCNRYGCSRKEYEMPPCREGRVSRRAVA